MGRQVLLDLLHAIMRQAWPKFTPLGLCDVTLSLATAKRILETYAFLDLYCGITFLYL